MLVVYYVFQFLLPVVVFSSFFPFGILLKVVFIKVGWRELINPAKVPYQSLEITLAVQCQIC
jgi:hypothetical protein